ncbi:hypothetical protein HXX76_009584 [Chlamydomonas incerta]|uniref:Uncharacterized protein n=1 Tax=Chlamydomonas incerta TaxID=51695 RepID=A0A835T4E6_CHLIN|nr:hypothetical protein HXX76_009584 [Chlamydomonas incerta]|eukprot:KAG2431570.1 hypothetical protein HXX76_009584 [Chlamydomonas incerta]
MQRPMLLAPSRGAGIGAPHSSLVPAAPSAAPSSARPAPSGPPRTGPLGPAPHVPSPPSCDPWPHGPPRPRRPSAHAPPPCASVPPHGLLVTVPEPLPSAAALPDEPPLRSEHIDMTRAIQRCRTWQQLRRLYWRVRTRQGPLNMVGFFTRLAALLGPSLPQLLGEEGEEEEEPQAGAAAAVEAEAGQGALGAGSPGREAAGGRDAAQAAAGQRGRGRGPGAGPRGQQAPPAPQQLVGLAERAALRQLVVRMMYDACSFTREAAAADLLDTMRREPLPPWEMPAFARYAALQVAQLQAAHQLRSGGGGGGGGLGDPDRSSQRAVVARAGAEGGAEGGGGADADAGRQLSFLEWLREHPETWEHPYEVLLSERVHHWRDPPGAGADGADVDADAGSSSGSSSSGSSSGSGARSRRAPLCYGPHELAALAWAAARLRLAAAVAPQHLAWLLDDLLGAAAGVMADFDGRQLSQLAYALSQMGPLAVPPPPWRRTFLAAARRRLFQMDAQSLANLAHALEPLRLSPDPPWLRDLLAATGAAMSSSTPGPGPGQRQGQGQERWGQARRPAPPELTQLAWAMFSLRRRLHQPREWAEELLALSDEALQAGAPLAPPPPPPAADGTASPASERQSAQAGFGAASDATGGAGGASSSGSGSSSGIVAADRGLDRNPYAPLGAVELIGRLQPVLAAAGAVLQPGQLQELRREMEAACARPGPRLPPPAPPPPSHGANAPAAAGEAPLDPDDADPGSPDDLDPDLEAWAAGGEGAWIDGGGATPLLRLLQAQSEPRNVLALWLLRQPPAAVLLLRRALRSATASDAAVGGEVDSEPGWLAAAVAGDVEAPGDLGLGGDGTGGVGAVRGGGAAGAAAQEPATWTLDHHSGDVTGRDMAVWASVLQGYSRRQQQQGQEQEGQQGQGQGQGQQRQHERQPRLLDRLHVGCWPGPEWLEALASASAAQLHRYSFRAQSLGIILWALADLGYSPPPGWLQPWLRRAAELEHDFRAQNLVSLLRALATWREAPDGAASAALRRCALRLLPSMPPRELQLAASALARLAEVPEPQPPASPPAPDAGALAPPASPAARSGRGGGGGHGGRGGRGRGEPQPAPGLFVVMDAAVARPEAAAASSQGSNEGAGGAAVAAGGAGGARPHRTLDWEVGALLVARAVQVSPAYSLHHLAGLLRTLLALRLHLPPPPRPPSPSPATGSSRGRESGPGPRPNLPASAPALAPAATTRLAAGDTGVSAAADRQQGGSGRLDAAALQALLLGSVPALEALQRGAGNGLDADADGGGGGGGARRRRSTERWRAVRRSELRELGTAALEAARAVVAAAAAAADGGRGSQGGGNGGGARGVTGESGGREGGELAEVERAAAALLPARWWREYVAALRALE